MRILILILSAALALPVLPASGERTPSAGIDEPFSREALAAQAYLSSRRLILSAAGNPVLRALAAGALTGGLLWAESQGARSGGLLMGAAMLAAPVDIRELKGRRRTTPFEGRNRLSALLAAPEDYPRYVHELDFPILEGLDLGPVSHDGQFRFYPIPSYEYLWTVPGIAKGASATIRRVRLSRDHHLEFSVEFALPGEVKILDFALTGKTRIIKGTAARKGTTREVLEIVAREGRADRSGFSSLAEILRDPHDFARRVREKDWPRWRNLPMGETAQNGTLLFAVDPWYGYRWIMPGAIGPGWKATLLESEVTPHGRFEIVVSLEKENVIRLRRFELNGMTRTISPNGRPDLGKRQFLDLVETPESILNRRSEASERPIKQEGLRELAAVLRSPSSFPQRLRDNSFPDLAGLPLGETIAKGDPCV